MGVDHFGKTLRIFKLLLDEFSQGVRWRGEDLADGGGREVVGDERCAWFGRPGGNRVR